MHCVAIIDHGTGNVFSVARACERVGLYPLITERPMDLAHAAAVVLPGVGAYGTAMTRLQETGMIDALRDFVRTNRPFFGICLGIQLLMSSSSEFGIHAGLGLIPGKVVRFAPRLSDQPPAKVPHMQWNRVRPVGNRGEGIGLLQSQGSGDYFYFVHSYYVVPDDPRVVTATTRYAGVEFASAIAQDNIFACQFHPERSGEVGLAIYRNFALAVARSPAVTVQPKKGII